MSSLVWGSRATRVVLLAGTILSIAAVGCSGGSSSPGTATPVGAGAAPPTSAATQPTSTPTQPTSNATAAPLAQQAHFFVSLGTTRAIVVAPAGAPLPAPLADGGPVAGAVLTYPDGSSQVADANGVFVPSASAYARGREAALEANSEAQPFVKVLDPGRSAQPFDAIVLGFAAASSGATLVGVRTLPAATELFEGDTLLVSIVAVDTLGLPAALGNATVSWTATTGTISPIAGTNAALYTAPSTSTPSLDTIAATVRAAGEAISLVSTSAASIVPRSSAATFAGTLANADGTPAAGAVALFTQYDTPRAFRSYHFLGLADAAGRYRALVPPQTSFATAIGIVGSGGPQGVGTFYSADSGANSGNAGSTQKFDLALPSSGAAYDDVREEAGATIQPPISEIRDAYAAANVASVQQPWATDSGLYPLLATIPTTFPFPAQPAPIATGLYAGWCSQWTNAGTPTLTVVENAGTSCTAAGNEAIAIVPATSSSFAFRRYRASNPYALGAPLDATAGGGARLIDAGSWSHAAAGPDNDVATVEVDAYGALSQTLGAPVSRETFRYAFARSQGVATTHVDNDALVDARTGRVVATATIDGTQKSSLDANGCFAKMQPATCYQTSGTVVRTLPTSVGAVQRTLAVTTQFAGDGSDRRTIATQNSVDDRSRIAIAVASRSSRANGACLVCADGSGGGTLSDSDGSTPLATFAIDAGGRANVQLLSSTVTTSGSPFALVYFAI